MNSSAPGESEPRPIHPKDQTLFSNIDNALSEYFATRENFFESLDKHDILVGPLETSPIPRHFVENQDTNDRYIELDSDPSECFEEAENDEHGLIIIRGFKKPEVAPEYSCEPINSELFSDTISTVPVD